MASAISGFIFRAATVLMRKARAAIRLAPADRDGRYFRAQMEIYASTRQTVADALPAIIDYRDYSQEENITPALKPLYFNVGRGARF